MMATSSRLTDVLTRIQRQYPERWQFADPVTFSRAIHDKGVDAETAVIRLGEALLTHRITYLQFDDAAREIAKQLGVVAIIGIGIGVGLLLAHAIRTPEEAFAALRTDFDQRMTALAEGLASGRIEIDAWQQAMQAELRRFHLSIARISGVSGQQAVEISQRHAGEQILFLNRWADQLRSGEFPIDALARLRQRAKLYGGSGHTTLSEAQGVRLGLPRLPFYPAENTQCHSNCLCRWRYERLPGDGNWDCYYELGGAEHCDTCSLRYDVAHPLEVRNGVVITKVPPEVNETTLLRQPRGV